MTWAEGPDLHEKDLCSYYTQEPMLKSGYVEWQIGNH